MALNPLLSLWAHWLDILFPPVCILCHESGPSCKGLICATCWMKAQSIRDPICQTCGLPMNFPEQEGLPGNTYLCVLCRKKEWAFDLARSLFVFDGPVRDAIHLMKYHGHFSAGIWLGSQMAEALNDTHKNTHTSDIFDGNRNENAMIIPVPLSSKRLRDREFNHAFLLAKSIRKAFDLLINPVALERIRDSKPQVGLTTQERWPNVRGVFKIKNPNMVREKKIILFDDVLTTGATVNECARILKKAGAIHVAVLTLARTL